MISHFRNFLVVKTVKKSRELIVCTDDEYDMIKQSAGNFTLENIIYALDLFQNTLVSIKGGATARIEVEMAFARLCEPKLEQSMDAVMDRLSSLERAVRSGVKIAPAEKAEVTQTPVSYENITPEKSESKQPVKEAETAPAPTPAEDISPAMPVQPESPVQNNISEKQEAPQNDQTQSFSQWADFMDILHREDIGLFGILAGSKGYIRGEYFLIDSPNPAFRDFIKTSTHTKAMKKALYELTGNQYKLGLFKRKNTEQQKRDPLEDLINMTRGSTNVDIK